MILLRDFSTKIGKEDIFKQAIWNESLHKISKDNGVRVANFATYRNLTAKSTMFPCCNIHKYAWTSPDGKTNNQVGHTLIDKQRHSSVHDV
jgi:hypothetical protein